MKKQLLLRAICHRVKGNLSQTGLSFEGDLSLKGQFVTTPSLEPAWIKAYKAL